MSGESVDQAVQAMLDQVSGQIATLLGSLDTVEHFAELVRQAMVRPVPPCPTVVRRVYRCKLHNCHRVCCVGVRRAT